MTKDKTPEALSDDDLDTVQGGGTAVGNPGEKDGIIWMDSSEGSGVKQDGKTPLLGDDFGYVKGKKG